MSDGLNPAQREAVITLNGPVLVLAAAGTGKTRVITFRIANLIRNGIKPSRILAMTFTNKAAREMKSRIAELLKHRGDDDLPRIGTFHSLCADILRQDIDRLGYSRQFTICDRADQDSIARSVLRSERIGVKDLDHRGLLWIIGQWKTNGKAPGEITLTEEDDVKHTLACKLYPQYQDQLKSANLVDFDDLLLLTERLLRDHADVRTKHQFRFDTVLVDEYQDTSLNQYSMLKMLVERHKNLCVVGDDDQSIYGWRGADIRNILCFQQDFPGTKVIRLEENYRSCPRILTMANLLIKHNRHRHVKEMKAARPTTGTPTLVRQPDETKEAEFVARDIMRRRTTQRIAFGDVAILFRTNEQPRVFETQLRASGIPYVLIGGYSFFDRREVRDILCWMKAAVNTNDEPSLERAVRAGKIRLTDAQLDKLRKLAVEDGQPLWTIMQRSVSDMTLAQPFREALSRLVGLFQRFMNAAKPGNHVSATEQLLADLNFQEEINSRYPDKTEQQQRWESVVELINMIGRFVIAKPKGTLEDFIDQATLEDRDEEQQEKKQKDAITLITLHSAKGLEYPVVYLVGLEEGLLPHERSLNNRDSLEEERRLCYVGITRARDHLIVTRAMHRTRYGRRVEVRPSPFLREMFEGTQASLVSEASSSASSTDAKTTPDSGEAVATGPANPANRARGFRQHRISKKPGEA